MSKGRAMEFSEHVEWIVAAVGTALLGLFRYVYRSISLRPIIADITLRLDQIERELSELKIRTIENTTRLEERRHES